MSKFPPAVLLTLDNRTAPAPPARPTVQRPGLAIQGADGGKMVNNSPARMGGSVVIGCMIDLLSIFSFYHLIVLRPTMNHVSSFDHEF